MKRAALIVGNNSYADPEIMNLRYAEKDALELHGMLKYRMGFDVTQLLIF